MALNFLRPNQNNYDPYANPVDPRRIMLVLGIGAAILVAFVILAISILGGDPKGKYMTMMAHNNNLLTTIEESQKRIRSSQLSKINSSANILLTSDSVALREQLQKKFNESNISDSAKSKAAQPQIAADLEEAVLLDKFDTTYRNIFREQINTIILIALEVRSSTKGKEFTPVMDKYIEDLKSIDTQLDQLVL